MYSSKMKDKLKRLYYWWFGITEEQPKNERILLICMNLTYMIHLLVICTKSDLSWRKGWDSAIVLFIIFLLIQLSFGIVYYIKKTKRLKKLNETT